MEPITNITELLAAIDTYFTTPRVPRVTGAETNTILRAMVQLLTDTTNNESSQFINNYLSTLPGYGPGRVLLSDFTWGNYVTSDPQLATPANLDFGTPTNSVINVSWGAVSNGTSYILQRDITGDFLSPVNIYSGPLTAFSVQGLTADFTYFFRVRALANNYQDSPYATGSATTAQNPTPGTTPLTNWPNLVFVTQTGNTINMDTSRTEDNGAALSANYIPQNGSGYVQTQWLASSLTGESATGALCVGPGTLLQGVANVTAAIWVTDSGQVFARYNNGAYYNTPTGAMTVNGYLRIRADGTNVYLEYSNDAITWITAVSTPQPAADLNVKVNIDFAQGGVQRKVSNIVGYNLS